MKFTTEVFEQILDEFPLSERMMNRRMIISGTFLLCLYGLMDEFNDVDVIVDQIDVFEFEIDKLCKQIKGLERIDEVLFDENYNSIKVEYNGIRYNFLDSEALGIDNNETYLTLDKYVTDETKYQFELDTLDHALKAKMDLCRHKDKDHLIKMVQNILRYNN